MDVASREVVDIVRQPCLADLVAQRRQRRPARLREGFDRGLQEFSRPAEMAYGAWSGTPSSRLPDAAGDLLVAGSRVGGQQDLRPLQLARRMLAAAQQRPERGAFFLAQLDPLPYIHSDPLEAETRRIDP